MKKIIYLFAVLLIFPALNSCENSLGYDPNVEENQVDNGNIKVEDTTETAFEPILTNFDFVEIYNIGGYRSDIWRYETKTNLVRVDTSSGRALVWLYLSLETPLTDEYYRNMQRRDYFKKFELAFAGAVADKIDPRRPQIFVLDGNPDSRQKIRFVVRKLFPNSQLGNDIALNGDAARSLIIFRNRDDARGIITGDIEIHLSDCRRCFFNTKTLQGHFTIKFKE